MRVWASSTDVGTKSNGTDYTSPRRPGPRAPSYSATERRNDHSLAHEPPTPRQLADGGLGVPSHHAEPERLSLRLRKVDWPEDPGKGVGFESNLVLITDDVSALT